MILPQTMPGIVIGSIFIFVLHHGRLRDGRHRRRAATSTSVGTLIYSKIGAVQYPQGAASGRDPRWSVLMVGVWVITRLSDPAGGPVIETMATAVEDVARPQDVVVRRE